MSSPLLTEALRWADIGRAVFPLVPGEKTPAVRWTTEATTDPHQLRAWFDPSSTVNPGYGLGLPTGRGLVVIDVDVPKGGEIDPAWPATRVVRTRSGGWHLHYYVDREVPNSVSKIAKGVDVRGDGGYVVSPPTPGWSWANPDHPIAEIAYAMLVPARRMEEEWRPFVQAEEPVGEGERNDYLARFVGFLVNRGIDDYEELLDLVETENERIVDPPLEASEVGAVTRSIWRYKR